MLAIHTITVSAQMIVFSSVQYSRYVVSDSLQPHGTAARQAFLSITHSPELAQTHVH